MKTILFEQYEFIPAITLCLGYFDGVHNGHRKLVLDAKIAAEGPLAVLLFDANPALYIPNGKSQGILTDVEDKKRLFAGLGFDYAIVVHVDKEFFGRSKEDFINSVICKINPSRIVCGTDYTFGRNAEGTIRDLEEWFPVVGVNLLEAGGKKIASRDIISFIEKGAVQTASELLGRPYEIRGEVVEGFHHGAEIGFPTANLKLSADYVLPKAGVYSGFVYVGGVPQKAIINVGTNPTVGVLSKPIVECHLLRYEGDLYGKTLYVDFVNRLRDEIKFADLNELKKQLEIDSQTALSTL